MFHCTIRCISGPRLMSPLSVPYRPAPPYPTSRTPADWIPYLFPPSPRLQADIFLNCVTGAKLFHEDGALPEYNLPKVW